MINIHLTLCTLLPIYIYIRKIFPHYQSKSFLPFTFLSNKLTWFEIKLNKSDPCRSCARKTSQSGTYSYFIHKHENNIWKMNNFCEWIFGVALCGWIIYIYFLSSCFLCKIFMTDDFYLIVRWVNFNLNYMN